ncbi:MAG: transcriptional regulator algP [Thiomonas sp.]
MRAAQRLLASLLPPSRLIWLVALALALQPLAWAQQPTAQWVSLPYCSTSAPSAQRAAQTPSPRHAHSLRVLLNPAAALSAAGAQGALPTAPGIVMAFAATPTLQLSPDWAGPRGPALTQTPQQPRAPPQLS